MLIDTHSHINFNAYKNDGDEVICRALDNNVWMINVGSQYATSKRAVEIAEKYGEGLPAARRGVFAAVGLHPIHLAEGIFKTKLDAEEISFQTAGEDFDYEKYKQLALSRAEGSSKVVAIGEIGLDYYYRPKTKTKLNQFKELQKTVLCKQLDLATELNLPIIFHCRAAHEDLIDMLNTRYPEGDVSRPYGADRIQDTKPAGVIHCFTGNWQQAQKYLEMGLYLGFNGIIFKPAPYRAEGSGSGLDLDEIIKKIPLEKILIETDCPYLTPPQESGRNEPLFVKYVAEKIAKLKDMDYKEISEITAKNARELFRI